MPITVIEGKQRGDEGKGRFSDLLAQEHDIVARWGGADNAGHTIVLENGEMLKLNAIPSGIGREGVVNVIGAGVLLNAGRLPTEIATVESKNIKVSPTNLKISLGASLILPHHVAMDEIREKSPKADGSTKSGVGPAASQKAGRDTKRAKIIRDNPEELRKFSLERLTELKDAWGRAGLDPIDEQEVVDRYVESALTLVPFLEDTTLFLNRELRKPKPARVLAEGAQAFLLDLDHGMVPLTTSSTPISAGAAVGLGVPPTFIDRIVGVAKAIPSHVGDGPFTTEIFDEELLKQLHGDPDASDAERGTKTGRWRRLGHLDLPVLSRSQMVNGSHEAALTKLDWVPRYGREILVCVAYDYRGERHEIVPDGADSSVYEEAEAVYESLPNWTEDISDVRRFDDLPTNAQNYIKFLEEHTGIFFRWLGVGQQADQFIDRGSKAA